MAIAVARNRIAYSQNRKRRRLISTLNGLLSRLLGRRIRHPSNALDKSDWWSGNATLLILGGILLEILLIWGLCEKYPLIRKWLATIADVAIGLGLVAEYICIQVAIIASAALKAESDARLTAATNRAAAAEEQLRRFRTPRSDLLSNGKGALITQQLKPFAGTRFDTGLAAGPGEPMHFLWNLELLIRNAGWEHRNWEGIGFTATQGSPTHGRFWTNGVVWADDVEIHIRSEEEVALKPAGDALIAALEELGIAARFAGFNTHSTNPSTIHILVGLKE